MTDDKLREILNRTRCVALVGASMNPARASHFVGQYMVGRGIRVLPVNPGHAGESLFGETVFARLADIPPEWPVDMLDIFRRSKQVLPVVKEALTHLPHLKTVWMQIGVQNEDAAALARAEGIDVVQNRCPKQEFPRLFGDG
ncbi:CoA-binding protein [Tabrizicola sp. DMG-N-6]|uniref:CoA-binding protein n=2 Tax=Szabonella alba TaxID=2804194 RepID=A0A8K0V6K2_9RHOB|nr:CoA-binding protein [Szabonella alba]